MSIPFLAGGQVPPTTCQMHIAAKSNMKNGGCKKHDGNRPTKCIDCPLCNLTILVSFFEKPFTGVPLSKVAYLVFKNTSLTSYYSKSWKPPDAFLFSTF